MVSVAERIHLLGTPVTIHFYGGCSYTSEVCTYIADPSPGNRGMGEPEQRPTFVATCMYKQKAGRTCGAFLEYTCFPVSPCAHISALE